MRKFFKFSGVIAFSLFFIVSFTAFAKGESDKSGGKAAEEKEVGGLPYEGVTLSTTCIEGLTAYPWREYAANRWAEKTGAKVNVVAFSFNNYYYGIKIK